MLVMLGCRPAPTPAATEPAASVDTPTRTEADAQTTTAPPATCPELAPRSEAEAAFEAGRTELEQSRSGDHFVTEKFEPAIAKLRIAAEANHAPARALLGGTLFGTMFTNDAPQPSERDAYIEAIACLRTAAIAGDPSASAFMPGLTAAQPPLHEMPLSEVPADWVAEAWRRADAWLACYGPPWS